MIQANARLFEIVSRFVSKEETRYYLGGVYVEPHPCGGVTLVATDGHRLMAIYDADGVASRSGIFNLSKEALRAAKGFHKKTRGKAKHDANPDKLVTIDKAGNAAVKSPDGDILATSLATEIEGTYPDYRRAIPQSQDTGDNSGQFNARYVADFADAGAGLSPDVSGFMALRGKDQASPHLVRWSGIDYAFGVIMPVRGDVENDVSPPAFLNARPFERAEVELSPAGPVFAGSYQRDRWQFTIRTRRSTIGGRVEQFFQYQTEAQCRRVYNRVLANLQARGLGAGLEPMARVKAPFEAIWADWAAKAATMADERAKRVAEATEAYAAASDADLARPWSLALVTDGVSPWDRPYRVMDLPEISEIRAVAKLYAKAA